MAQPIIPIPVEHHPAVYEVETEKPLVEVDEPEQVTLLELIDAVSEVSESEQEVVATVTYMLNSGRVRLSGNFRDTPVSKLCS